LWPASTRKETDVMHRHRHGNEATAWGWASVSLLDNAVMVAFSLLVAFVVTTR
jgi:hypothetical protein